MSSYVGNKNKQEDPSLLHSAATAASDTKIQIHLMIPRWAVVIQMILEARGTHTRAMYMYMAYIIISLGVLHCNQNKTKKSSQLQDFLLCGLPNLVPEP